jgi:thiamine-monophosphate kinase
MHRLKPVEASGFMLGLIMSSHKKAPTPLTELALIEQIRSGWGQSEASPRVPRTAPNVVLGIGDDCAILRPPRGHEFLVTTDFTLEGSHFRRDLHPPESVGHRALARGLSDLAAMGARPMAAFLSLALPCEMLATRTGRIWVQQLFTGLRSLANRSRVPLAGGDTAESPCGLVLADIVLVGSAPAGRALRRSGARPGDLLYVTGSLGGSAAELARMQHPTSARPSAPRAAANAGQTRPPATGTTAHPQLYPEPRLAVGRALLHRRLATAAIDLSDGLSTDLAHLCRESRVGAEFFAAALPIHPLAREGAPPRALSLALHGGEDYELLFAARPSTRVPRSIAGLPITRIGRVVRGSAITIVDSTGHKRPLAPGGWEHFANRG